MSDISLGGYEGGGAFFDWAGGAAKELLNAYTGIYAQNKTQDYEIQKLRIQALGQYGMYDEGQPIRGTVAGVNSSTLLLLAGAAVVAYMLAKN